MSIDPRIERLRKAAATRSVLIVLAGAAAGAIAAVVLAARVGGFTAALPSAALALGVLAGLAWHARRSVDATWLARRLDAQAPSMDDSTALLFRDPATLSPLQSLQRTRLLARLDALQTDVRPPWPRARLAACLAAGLLLLAFAAIWRPDATPSRGAGDRVATQAPSGATRLLQVELEATPPAYTQLAPIRSSTLDAKLPQGSVLRWRLRFEPAPRAAALQFHDGTRVALVADGDAWRGEYTLDVSALYRIVLDGVPAPIDDRLYRLDAIADRAPEIRLLVPDKTLSLMQPGQKSWDLAYEASDDYGIAQATLTVTHAQGTGENIAFKEQVIVLDGTPPKSPLTRAPPSAAVRERDERGPRVVLRYSHTIDLAALGFSMGDDVVVRLAVTDNREPGPNTTRSASTILRWPAAPSQETAGLDGIVQKTMPAYFRSQRQIIIDTEALIAEKARLDEAKLLARSDSIGVDQKLLRLRYGQFLGEESEGHAEHAPEGAVGGADTQAGALAGAHAAQEQAAAPGASPTKFGEAGNVVAEYGHVHDIAEAATLLDPQTKATLKSALGEMWQAELHLRQGHPDDALPYEQRALELIKQVQQATRIYLARVGLELPTPDEARRLSGERKDLVDRVGTLAGTVPADAAVVDLWRALDRSTPPDWDAATRALAARGSAPEVLGAIAALDRARRAPDCSDCRLQLRRALWPLLPTPPAASAPRTAPDAGGRAYLDALRAASQGFSR